MMTTLRRSIVTLAAVALLPEFVLAQKFDVAARVLSLKQAVEKDQAALRTYEWIETTVISYKGQEQSRAQKRCYYGADGSMQKVPVASSSAAMPGGVRGRLAQRKKQDVTAYMQKAAALIQQYVPPAPATLHRVFQAGRTSAQILEPGRRGRFDFHHYLVADDVFGVEVNLRDNSILGIQVDTYIDQPDDAVTLKVAFATLADGTGYPALVTLDAVNQKVRVVIRNTGYRRVLP